MLRCKQCLCSCSPFLNSSTLGAVRFLTTWTSAACPCRREQRTLEPSLGEHARHHLHGQVSARHKQSAE